MSENKQLYKLMEYTVIEDDDKEYGNIREMSYIFTSKKDAFKCLKNFVKNDIKNNYNNIYYNIYPIQL